MKPHFLLLTVLLLMAFCVNTLAAPVLTNGTVTTFIGDNNYMYLQASDGSLHRLQAPILDLVSMDAENLYCLTQDYRLYSVRLDGSSSSMISSNVTGDVLSSWRSQPVFELNNQVLTLSGNGTTATAISGTCLAACANHDTLFYLQQDPATSFITLHAKAIDLQRTSFSSLLEGKTAMDPLSMTASKDAVCIVGKDHSIQVFSIATGEMQMIPASSTSPDIACAICAADKILSYTVDENGFYHISASYDATIRFNAQTIVISAVTQSPFSTVTAVLATPTQRPVITARPTVRPTRTPTRKESYDEDETIHYGARGKRVRKMQQRLLDLGYPVGKVDGAFGAQTLLGLNLFQDAIGYTNRKSCTANCYSRLMAKSAPKFDLYRPLKKGNRGKSVELMQQMLIILGYGPDKADGIYGDLTVSAVAAFQLYAGLPVDGTLATPNTLFALYTLMNPLESPTPTPIPTATPVPTPVITATVTPVITAVPTATSTVPSPTQTPDVIETVTPPAQDPTDSPAPTETPTSNPTEEPSEAPAPTEEPTHEPTETPTESQPTEAPTAAPTEVPVTEPPVEKLTPQPTEAPTPKPTEAPTPAPTEKPTELVEKLTPRPTEEPAPQTTDAPASSSGEAEPT